MISLKVVWTVLHHNAKCFHRLVPASIPDQKVPLLKMYIRPCRIHPQRLVITPERHIGISLLLIHHSLRKKEL